MMTPSAPLRVFPPQGGDAACGPAKPVPRLPLGEDAPLCASGTVFGVLAVIVALSGCDGRNLGNPWFPLREGEQHTLAVQFTGDEPRAPEQWTLRVTAPTTFQDQPVAVRHHSAGVSYYLLSDDQGIRRIATRTDIDNEPSADAEPLWVLKAPYQVGTEWTTPTVPYLIQRKNEHPRDLKYTHKALMTWRIEAVDDSVTLADGSAIKPCLRVVGEARLNLYTDPVNGFTDVPLISREWYCQGQGLVKLEREEKVPNGFLTGGVLRAEWVP
ncbi:MAG: hypothetical protein Q8K50_05985 [Hydrogenophaga sp.]|nr:hypothetical protein [Hydrogenophaga sp.]